MRFLIPRGRRYKQWGLEDHYRKQIAESKLITRREMMRLAGASVVAASFAQAEKARATFLLGGSSSLPAGFWLPSSHYVLSPVATVNHSNQTATQIYPRPDSETNTYAFHRNHYWDGSVGLQQAIPICMRGGGWPYNFIILSAPVASQAHMGASQWTANWSIAQALAAGYGDLIVDPNGPYSGQTFWVRAFSQDFTYNDFIYTAGTVAGYDATNHLGFVFIAPGGSNPGSYPSSGVSTNLGSPIQTMNWAYGATATTVTYPNAILVCRAGTTATFAQSAQFGIQPTKNCSPMALVAYPGESVTIDMTNAGSSTTGIGRCSAFDVQSGGDDMFFQNLTLANHPSTGFNFHAILDNGTINNRMTLHNVAAPNIWSGTDPTDNAAMLTLLNPGSGLRNYLSLKGCSDTNVSDASGSEAFGLYVVGSLQYGLVDLSVTTGSTSYGPWWKWSCQDVTFRNGKVVFGAGFKQPGGSGDYIVSSELMQNQEVCHSILDGSALNSGGGYAWALIWNESAVSNGASSGLHASYRNTVNGWLDVRNPTGNTGPFTSQNDAIQYGVGTGTQPILIGEANTALPGNVTNSGTTAQASSGVFNSPGTGDYSFKTAYASQNGIDGANIA